MKRFTLLLTAIAVMYSYMDMKGQNIASPWTDIPESTILDRSERYIIPSIYRTLEVDLGQLTHELNQAPKEFNSGGATFRISLPLPDGSMQNYDIVETSVMAAPLAAKYPLIKTYKGRNTNDPAETVRLDFTHQGFHAMIRSSHGVMMIDPYSMNTQTSYISYRKKDLERPSFVCETEDDPLPPRDLQNTTSSRGSAGELRVYRLALATTAEYGNFHGGTLTSIMSAIVTAVNRVNEVYEEEISIRLELIANNDTLINFGSSTSDPFSNNSGFAMLGQNQTYVDNLIGSANYDFGHVFSTGGGGVASLGSVCTNSKARGVTGLNSPIGDPFYIDFVSHEMGHQLRGNHTFNGSSGNCSGGNRNGPTAYEPGSGTTIMAYAGICAPQNIQNNSDAYFHAVSLDEIITFTTITAGSTCGTTIATGNTAPTVSVPSGGFTIPMSTPFELGGSGADADGDTITYCWEQFDLGPAGHPNSPVGNAPLFRSFLPKADSFRIFPRIQNIINNNQTLGERLPDYARSMNFRLTIRDNHFGGGCITTGDVTFDVSDIAGPFLVTLPNTSLIWQGGSFETVTWDVANTDMAPVNCSHVNIRLSTDGGFTYPIMIAQNLPNTGSATVVVPDISGTTNRIRVEAADNIFFDISNTNFTIMESADPGFALLSQPDGADLCASDSLTVQILTSPLKGLTDPVTFTANNFPAGASANFAPATIVPGDTLFFTLSNTAGVTPGVYDIELLGSTSGGITNSTTIQVVLENAVPVATALDMPANGSSGLAVTPTFNWAALPGNNTYTIEIATNPSFGANIVETTAGINDTFYTATSLLNFGVYYWRVTATNICGTGPVSSTNAFQTESCIQTQPTDLPQNLLRFGNLPLIATSNIDVASSITISDVNILGLSGTHSRPQELQATVTSPTGTVVTLFSNNCLPSITPDFNLSLDDESSLPIPCDISQGGVYQPIDSLSDFDGENSNGTWTLTISDTQQDNAGVWESWSLELCSETPDELLLLKNEPLDLSQGKTRDITQQFLEATAGTLAPSEISYTLVSLPDHGDLFFNGTALMIGDEITQAQINGSLFSYAHDSSQVLEDKFTFTLTTAAGDWLGTPEFLINVWSTGLYPQLSSDISLSVLPNPATTTLQVIAEGSLSSSISISMFTAHGQIIKDQVIPVSGSRISHEFNVSSIAQGIYWIRVQTAKGTQTKKVMIVR